MTRAEVKAGLFFVSISMVINRFVPFPDFISGFLSGLFISLGIVLFVVSLLPEKTYNKLLYRQWLAAGKQG